MEPRRTGSGCNRFWICYSEINPLLAKSPSLSAGLKHLAPQDPRLLLPPRDSTLLELTANGELILAGGSGNGDRFAELGTANNPSG